MHIMLNHFEIVANAVIKKGGSISFEWPDCSAYWKDEHVQAVLKRLDLTFVSFDGCTLGWKSLYGRNGNKGKPIRKRLRIYTTSVHKLNSLAPYQCPGPKVHNHAPAEGKDTAHTASYTPEFCTVWHNADIKDAADYYGSRSGAIPARVAVSTTTSTPTSVGGGATPAVPPPPAPLPLPKRQT